MSGDTSEKMNGTQDYKNGGIVARENPPLYNINWGRQSWGFGETYTDMLHQLPLGLNMAWWEINPLRPAENNNSYNFEDDIPPQDPLPELVCDLPELEYEEPEMERMQF